MKTVDLRSKALTIQELLRMAQSDSLLILADDDHSYTLEEADEFEKEVAMLGQSVPFVEFLKERSKEPGSVSLKEVERRLNAQGNSERGPTS